MHAAIALLLLLHCGRAAAQTPPHVAASHFSQALAAEVFTGALSFIEPRSLEPHPLPTLALWGLGGISALDPSLSVTFTSKGIGLSSAAGLLASAKTPDSYAAWGRTIAALISAAWRSSSLVRAAGQGGVFAAFFDELFGHFDPYSRYLSPQEAARDRAERMGRAGVGIRLTEEHNFVVVAEVLANGPAARAGVVRGARLISVDGISTAGKAAATVAGALAGVAGTKVTLTFLRPDHSTRRVSLVRSSIPPETVFISRKGKVLVLRITSFDQTTGPHLANEIAAGLSVSDRPRGIVLDLRGNRGGLLDQAIYVGHMLLQRGVIATTRGRDPRASHVWYASGPDMANNLPIVVIVNGRTASAAEIVAAALADNGRAVVVGSTTLGKGLVQAIKPLPNGGAIFLTWSRVLAPRGWPIQELGVLPQVCTSLGPLTLERDLSALANGSQPMLHAIYAHETARAPMSLGRVLSIRAACPAATDGTGDLMAAEELINDPASYATALLPPAGHPLLPAATESGERNLLEQDRFRMKRPCSAIACFERAIHASGDPASSDRTLEGGRG